MSFNLVYYSQNDPQWKADILGFGDPGDTIGYVGCALTSVSMLLSGYGFTETPKTLNEKLKAANGFVSAGIRWDVVSQVHPQVTLKSNIPCETTDAPLAQIDASLAAGQPVVVRVDNSPAPGLQWHYVLLYARKGNDYLMLDPWPYKPGTTTEDLLMARYSQGNPLQRAIQQVLFYQSSTSGGTISTPPSTTTTTTPQPSQPTTAPATTGGIYIRPTPDVTAFVYMRTTPDTTSTANVVAYVYPGTQLLIIEPGGESKIGVNGQFVRVRDPQGHEGLVAAWFMERVPGAAPAPATGPASSPASKAPASSSTTPTTSAPSTTTDASVSSTPAPAPEPPKFQVIVKSNGTKIYSTATSSSVISIEKARARLTVVEPADPAKAKVGVKGQRINVKATNNKRGYVDAENVRLS